MRCVLFRLVPVASILIALAGCTSTLAVVTAKSVASSKVTASSNLVPAGQTGSSASGATTSAQSIGVTNTNLQSACAGRATTCTPIATTCNVVGIGVVSTCSIVPRNSTDCRRDGRTLASLTPYALGPNLVSHPAVICGQAPFSDELDFRNLIPTSGTTPDGGCTNVPNRINSRPCFEPLRAEPNFAVTPAAYGWRPQEGDLINIACQARGNNIFGQGYLRNNQWWYSNIWDLVINPQDGQNGYVSDLWMGNQGWRGVPCALN